MPTPVSTARQCLTDEAARALDAAVAIARRRSHTQTTSLHALSALLSLPSSPLLRDACSRSHCAPYSPRLQFRALDLCVGVSLDRLPTAKTTSTPHQPDHHHQENDDHSSPSPSASPSPSSPPPPISNSLMAAIKRSQANQRRQPEMYQITHFHPSANPISSISAIKVELKNFVVSILDDPIVSRVLGEAGFRSHDIKLAILHPPAPPPSSPAARFLRAAAAASRFPPPLLNVPFPFQTTTAGGDESGSSYYTRRIGEILMKRSGSGRNPLLVGVCARDALTSFRECVEQRKAGLLPAEVTGVSFGCLEMEIQGFMTRGDREKVELKIKEFESLLEKHGGPGLVVSYGDLNVLLSGDGADGTKFLVSKLSCLVQRFKDKMWLIGWAASSDTCKKFLAMFPSLDHDWDLQTLPVTSSRSTVGGLYSRSSLMGSFVPFGGFFSTPSEFGNNPQIGVVNPPPSGSSSRCALCNEKFNQELSAMMKAAGSSTASSVSAAPDRCSSTLPSWLQTKESSKPQDATVIETSDKVAESNANVLRLQEKWSEICQRLHHHHTRTPNNQELSITRSQAVPCSLGFLNAANNRARLISDSGDRLSSSLDSSAQVMVQSTSSLQTLAATPAVTASLAENVSEPVSVTSRSFSREAESAAAAAVHLSAYHSPIRNLPSGEHKSPSSVSSVTTDLGLGALHATSQEPKRTNPTHVGRGVLEQLSSATPWTFPDIAVPSKKSVEGSDCYKREYNLIEDPEDYKQILKKLTERVPWQVEACQNISRMLSSFRGRKGNNGLGPLFNQQQPTAMARGLWMVLTGPDKMGKKKVGSAIADAVFGSRDSLIAVDLSSQEDRVMREPNNLVCDSVSLLPNDLSVRSGRKTVVDYLVDGLRRKPHSVVVMENVDQSDDLVVQRSLSRAIQTGRLPDSHGREINISNAIFVMTCSSSGRESDDGDDQDLIRFTEERILDARIWQMKISVEQVDEEKSFNHNNDSNNNKRPSVVVIDSTGKNRGDHHHVSKRRLSHSDVSSMIPKKPRRCLLDLNVALPVEEGTETDSFPDPSSRAWWAEFEHRVEGEVGFKSVNFDMMAEKLINLISGRLERVLGKRVGLEIDEEAMVMMLGAAWSSENEGAVEGWTEEVLGGAFMEAARRRHYRPEGESASSMILKLVACTGNPVDKRAPGICLPGSINLG